jgi:hypothetical protein
MGDHILMLGVAVQPIQNGDMGIAGAPKMEYQRKNSSLRRFVAVVSKPAAFKVTKYFFAF